MLGDFDLAEEAVQDAFVVALQVWPERGVPRNPGAWITTTARNKALDRIRRARRLEDKLRELEALAPSAYEDDEMPESSITDDRLFFGGGSVVPRLSILQALARIAPVTSPVPVLTSLSPSRVRAGMGSADPHPLIDLFLPARRR